MTYLPPVCQPIFERTVTEFLYLPWIETQQLVLQAHNSNDTGGGGDDGGGISNGVGNSNGGGYESGMASARGRGVSHKATPIDCVAAQTAWLRENIPARMTPALLRVVGDVWRHVSGQDDDAQHRFPKMPGSYLTEVCQCCGGGCFFHLRAAFVVVVLVWLLLLLFSPHYHPAPQTSTPPHT